ncbi:MAG: hypothetical protein LBF97_05045 [Elusimicrobiota bacterium]|jgi:hypothetical protein|nr:hypothetical protein [Elusimicrobiota bacterium]
MKKKIFYFKKYKFYNSCSCGGCTSCTNSCGKSCLQNCGRTCAAQSASSDNYQTITQTVFDKGTNSYPGTSCNVYKP